MVDKILAHFDGTSAGKIRERNLYGMLGRAWSAQPPWLTSRILPLKSYLREFYLDAMRRRRRAYAMPLNEESGAIRINLRGREPIGLVAPGDEYETLVSGLREAFLALRDSESGLPLVSEVLLARDLVPEAAYSPTIPDIFIKWNRTKRMASVQSERLGLIETDFFPARTGDHHVDGLVLSNREILKRNISVLDFAPTIAALHGIKRPERWRGSAFIEPESRKAPAAA
jgi:predicted AlkP superfamily phosphohydrolase/phosphomutase